MLADLGKVASFLLSLLSLEALLASAFFVPGMEWSDRLTHSLTRIVIAASICFASGLMFEQRAPGNGPGAGVLRTLPMRLFFFALLGMAILFLASWYLATYYLPMTGKFQPY